MPANLGSYLLRRLWYEQIMNKPAQLALAHRPTAQPGPQFDETAPAGPQIGGANPSKPIFGRTNPSAWPAAVQSPRATISTFSANEAKFRKRSQLGKRSENNV
jgi:hypothetical protein